ncbi:hypothetical protein M9458_035400, partial [Cirrhinus mrigala]
APLQPLPVISAPFRRIAMDIVGPLEKSSAGHRYILVVSDYATRYPEAFPLRSITTPKIIHALVQLFSRFSIPKEILTDQGTNFTLRLMGQLNKQLGITMDGLVERFNQTLKNMLRKFVADTGRDWDKWLPFVLFAYREVPQDSAGFSPFELLYGWQVQGPLDLLKRSWEETPAFKMEEKGIVQYVLEMRDHLERTYNKNSKHRKGGMINTPGYDSFNLGRRYYSCCQHQQASYWLNGKGHAPWSARWGQQTYHVNLLKEWKLPPGKEPETSFLVRKVERMQKDSCL